MSKFKKGNLITGYQEQQTFQEQQAKLREKNNIQDDSVVVVEKSNMAKFTVKTISAILRIAALVVLLALAAVGVICLIYPSTRLLFFSIFDGTMGQLQGLLGL